MDRVAFITGGTRGIGRQIAIKLSKAGYKIAVNYRTENENLKITKSEIEKIGGTFLAVRGDVTDFEACKNV